MDGHETVGVWDIYHGRNPWGDTSEEAEDELKEEEKKYEEKE